MALTKIKTGGIADNAVTDAKVADAITVTGAQTGITQTGTLTSLATSGVVGVTVANVSGVTASTDADDLVIENTVHNGISILTNDNQTSNLYFGQASSNRTARVDYAGDTNIMHVGTTKASGQLQLQSANGTTGITLDASSNTTFAGNITIPAGNAIFLDGGGDSKVEEFATNKVNIQAGADNLVIDGSGSRALVGIGLTSPSKNLHIKSGVSEDTGIIIENTNNAQNLDIDYWNNAGAVQGRIRYAEGAGSLNFQPNQPGGATALSLDWNNNATFSGGVDIIKNSGGGHPIIKFVNHVNDGEGATVQFRKSRNTTIGSHTVVQDNDELGNLTWYASDGNSWERSAAIKCFVDGAPGDGDVPARLEFQTTADGASAPATKMTIAQDGGVGIGTNEPLGGRLHLQGKELLMRSPGGTNQFYIWGSDVNANNCGVSIYQDDGTQTIQLHTDGASYFTGGGIGIGLTSPQTHGATAGIHLANSTELGFGDGANNRPDFGITGDSDHLNIFCGEGSDTVDIKIDTNGCLYLVDESQYLYLGGTKLSGEHNTNNRRLQLHGSGDNTMLIGPYEDNGWGYIVSSNNSNGIYFGTDAGSDYNFDTGTIRPYSDNEISLGVGNNRFVDCYLVNNPTVTSDERMKDNIKMSSLGLDFLNQLNPVQYKWKDYETYKKAPPESEKEFTDEKIKHTYKRTHYGLIAQEVEKVLTDSGMTAEDFAPLTYDKDADLYGMRYSEYVGILIKAVQELSAKVTSLENA